MANEVVTNEERSSSILRLLLILTTVIIIIAGIRFATSIITTFALAFVITVSVTPLLHWLQRRRLPSWLAFAIVFLFVLVILLFLLLIVFVSIQQFINTLPGYQDRIAELKVSLGDALQSVGVGQEQIQQFLSLNSLQPANLVDSVIDVASSFTAALSNWAFILFLAAMMLFESVRLPDKLVSGVRKGSPMPERLIAFNKNIRNYFALNAWLGFLAAALETAMLLVLGVDFALLWGVVSFIFSFVPYVGFVVSFTAPALFALLEFGLTEAIIVFVGYLVINTVVDNVLTPKVMGRGLNLSPLVIVISVLFWSWVMGPLGAILSVPMTLMVKELVLESSDESRWLAVLME